MQSVNVWGRRQYNLGTLVGSTCTNRRVQSQTSNTDTTQNKQLRLVMLHPLLRGSYVPRITLGLYGHKSQHGLSYLCPNSYTIIEAGARATLRKDALFPKRAPHGESVT